MGREVKESQHLLDNAEQNIGNSQVVPPQIGPGGPSSPSGTTIPQTNPPRILQLSGPSQKGQTTSVIMTASRLSKGPSNPNPGLAGPITGVIEFGNGGQSTRVEFDVPIGPFIGTVSAVAPASEPQDGGTIITVPTGVLRAYARYDNLLIAPALSSNLALAQIQGAPFLGPGGPIGFPVAPPNNVGFAEPVQTKAMAAYFSRHTSRVYKTLFLYVAAIGGMGGVAVTVDSNPPGNGVSYCLPAFARSVKVLRWPLTAALTCSLSATINYNCDQFDVVSGVSAPIVPIMGQESIITLKSLTNGNADKVVLLAVVCEIGI
jgi:hypothetical protein